MKTKMDYTDIDDIVIVRYHGEMTFFFLSELENFLRSKIAQKRHKFIFDLTDTTWIDSMGLGLMAMIVKVSLLNGKKVGIVNPSDMVKNALNISSLLDLMIIYKTVDDAIRSFNN